MSQGPRYRLPFKRRRLGITDYRKRKNLLKSRKIRAVIRRSLRYITIQFVKYNEKGDEVLVAVTSKELEKYGWNGTKDSTPAAYLTGIIAGIKAKEKGINECIVDIGRYTASRGARVFAAIKGIIDAGVECPCDESMFPSEERIKGEHLQKKLNVDVFEIKDKIMGGEK